MTAPAQLDLFTEMRSGAALWPDGDQWLWRAYRGEQTVEGSAATKDDALAARDRAWWTLVTGYATPSEAAAAAERGEL